MENTKVKETQTEQKKMSYEELENVAHQLSEQSRELYNKLQEMNYANLFKRLDYLFKVVEFSAMFDSDFVIKCTDEIKGILTVPQEEKQEKEPKINKSGSKEIPLYTIAPFKSGKETYKYFYDRGFNKEDVKEFMIGRDLKSKTVTIPIFNAEDKLVGVIGRYISKNRKHNERYKIYSFERGKLTYPLNKFEPINDTMIIVEGSFDSIRMHKLGYKNTQALMSNNMTVEQADLIASLVSTVIYIGDNDNQGVKAKEENIKMLKERDIKVLIVDYPDYGKDPCDWKDKDIHNMVNNAHSKRLNIRRL